MAELFETVGDVERRALAKLTEMTRPINTTTAPALPDEMVTRATKAMLRADGWTAQEIADQCKKGEGTTLRPFTAEILAEVALTAAGVPGLLAEVERLRTHTDEVVGRCVDVLGGGLCQDHHDHVRSIAFTEFVEWDRSLGCKACLETNANLARRERDDAQKALRILCQLIGWNGHRKWLDTIPTPRDVEAAVRRVLGEEVQNG